MYKNLFNYVIIVFLNLLFSTQVVNFNNNQTKLDFIESNDAFIEFTFELAFEFAYTTRISPPSPKLLSSFSLPYRYCFFCLIFSYGMSCNVRKPSFPIHFKHIVKNVCEQNGLVACFMAKPDYNLPGAGAHIHQSLRDLTGKKNIFFNKNDELNMSEDFKNYIAGILEHLDKLSILIHPNINSFKRVQDNYNEIKKWVKQTDWAEFVLTEEYREFRSPINSCIKIKI